MQIISTPLNDAFIIKVQKHGDNRGYFFESFNAERFSNAIGIDITFVQDNQAYSTQNVVRGLHFQLPPFAQAKLVRAISGTILDVIVDLRRASSSYGQVYSVELSGANNRQLFVPRGFAHGYSVLSPEGAVVAYKCDNGYHPECESGIHPQDPTLNIDWGVEMPAMILSEKDKKWPVFKEFISQF